MHCTEARNRIDNTKSLSALADDLELQVHLEDCDDCRAYAVLVESFEKALHAASADDTVPGLAIDEQRRAVELRLHSGRRAMRGATHPHLLARPAWRLAVSGVTIVLAAFLFIPFTRYQTVGYDVSVDGTCLEVAVNHDRICDLLGRLGLDEAGVDVIGCDTTCSVSILDLKTEHEARMVVGAIAHMCEKKLSSSIVPIRAKSTQTLLEQANDLILRSES